MNVFVFLNDRHSVSRGPVFTGSGSFSALFTITKWSPRFVVSPARDDEECVVKHARKLASSSLLPAVGELQGGSVTVKF